MTNRKHNARLTAVTKEETKEYITKKLNDQGETVSNFMLVTALDRLMDRDISRAESCILEFRDLVIDTLKSENEAFNEEMRKSLYLLSSIYNSKILPETIKKRRNLHKIAIEGYLYDNIAPQKPNDSDSAEIATTHEGILLTLTREGIIDEDQAHERSIFDSVFDTDDKKELINNEFST